MPIYKEYDKAGARILIWKIGEPEAFFQEHTGLESDKKSEVRRLEHLAGRFLLQQAVPGLALTRIEISHLGKPFLPGNELHFSISHSFPFIGVAVDDNKEIGIDVQTLEDKILRLQHKFLSAEEQVLCEQQKEKITLAWAAKEAAFKRYGLGAVDFIKHMPIREMQIDNREATLKMEFTREQPAITLDLCGGIEPDFAWSVTL
jgi:phosphopantetheinyl transferase